MNSTIPSQPEQGNVWLLATTVVTVLVSRSSPSLFFFFFRKPDWFIRQLVISATAIWKHVQDPLYRFPGPFLAAWSYLPYTYWLFSQRQPFKLTELHEKYGPVVRIAPNQLSFNTAASYQDIYGSRQGQHQTFLKSNFYDAGAFSPQAHSIITERDPIRHAKQKKYVSAAFSDKALKSQEGLINEVVDKFIKQLGVHASGEQGANLVTWFSLATFDIIGSLSFGESFGGVESGKCFVSEETSDEHHLLTAWPKSYITLGWSFYRGVSWALHSQTPPFIILYYPRLSSCFFQNSSTACLRTSRAFKHMCWLWSEGKWVFQFAVVWDIHFLSPQEAG